MLNLYSKLTTAFAALAIICSTSMSAQCEDVTLTLYDSYGDGGGSINIDGVDYPSNTAEDIYVVCLDLSVCTDIIFSGDSWSYESSWDIVDSSGAVIASGADESGSFGCLPTDCVGTELTDVTASWQGDGYCDDGAYGIYFTCDAYNWDDGDCGHCVDASALNYGVFADCVFPPNDCLGNAFDPTLLTYQGDGWCDDGAYGVDFQCDAYNWDDGDCGHCVDASALNYGVLADCEYTVVPDPCIDVSIVVSGGSYPSEIGWTVLDSDGNVAYDALTGDMLSGGAPFSGVVCLNAACYTLIGTDSYGDGWNGGATATVTVAGNDIASLSVVGDSGQAAFCVSNDVEGCTNETASNYNPEATIDDGSCCLGDLVTINLYDSFGDGWCFYPTGDPEGGLEIFGQFFPYCAGSSLSLDFCLDPGCYTGQTIGTNYTGEISWDVVVGGSIIASGGYGEVFFSTDPSCVSPGCNDAIACNYDPAANVNDGSCDYASCAGCTDAGACNYDAAATLDDASCDFSCVGCMDAIATNYDAASTIACADCCAYCEGAFAGVLNVGGGSWDSEIGWSLTLDGVVAVEGGAGSFALCLDAGCYVLNMTDAYGDGWNGGSYSFDGYDGVTVYSGSVDDATSGDGGSEGSDNIDMDGGCTSGCTDAGACNYDGANYDDGSCDYSCIGCMDATAANFDPNATLESGECVYCDAGTFVLSIDMTDSFGDGWGGAQYFIFDLATGGIAAQGSIDAAFSGDGLSVGTDMVCLAPGCYNVQVSAGDYPAEIGVSLSDQFGTSYGSTGGDSTYALDFLLTGSCGFEGCTSPSALNYNVSATIDDGSCQEPPANDQLSNAEALFCGAYASGNVLYATDDQGLIGSTFGNAEVTTAGVWYVFNSGSDQQVVVSTCDTPSNEGDTDYTTDTKLHVYTMGADGSLDAISSNDDGCATGYLSTAAFNAATGIDYFIYVSEYSAFTTGNDFVLSVECIDCGDAPSNDDCDGAVAQITGVTFTGSTCCASAEEMQLGWAGLGTAYGVWFTFNSANYNTFYFNITNISNDVLGFVMMEGNECEGIEGFVGCQFTGSCAGSVEGFLPQLLPDVDYYFLIYTADPTTCGEFEFTTTGIILGCTDIAANNYNDEANQDDGSCDFDGVTPPNDTCADAIALDCNTVTIGSTGGSSAIGAPIGVEGCEVSPGAGVWYSFVGDGQLNNLSTCGSAIDSKINIFTATEECGGGSIDVPAADACGDGLVTVNLSVGGGSWDSEIGFDVVDANGAVVFSGGAGPYTACLAEGDYTINMTDAYADGWNGGAAIFSNGLGETMGYASLDGIADNGASGSATISIAAYSMDPIFIAGDFDCFATASSSDGTGACSLYDNDDVNFEFVSEVGVLYYVYVGAQDSDANPMTDDNGAFDLVFDCATVVEGCMNPAACNYDDTANVSTDTCDFWSCVCATETGVSVMVNMVDAFGDGWNGAGYSITDLAGNPVASGDLDNAQFFVDNDNYAGPEYGFDMVCLEPGCYNISVTTGDWASEVTWNIEMEDGSILVAGGAPDSQTISVGGAVCGCTDAGACNYNETATDEDNSCEYVTCAGCTDTESCSYNVAATIDDGTCCYSNCVDMQMLDSFGDGWNGGYYVLSTVDGTEVGTGTIAVGTNATDSYCLADGCYTIEVVGATWSSEMTWNIVGAFGGLVSGVADESYTFNVGSGDECVVGCAVSCACNYDPSANIADDAQCVFDGCDGCTYADASNYDESAAADDGSCVFDIANACPADLNGDGSITTGDLLIFLGAFGTICE